KITFGTGAFALTLTGALTRGNGPLPTIAWSDQAGENVHALDGGVYAASSAVNWARGLGLFSDFAEIDDFTGPPAISRGIAFVPALAGLACPHWDRTARGAWMGLSLDSMPIDLAQAVLEGVAFRTAEVMSSIAATTAVSDPVSIDGGMSRNPWFCQFLSDVLGRPLYISDEPELTALGCAQLAAVGAGFSIERAPGGRLLTPRPVDPQWFETFSLAREAVRTFGARR